MKLHLNGEFVTQNIFSIYGDRSPDTQADERQALRKRIPTELLEDGSRDCLLGILAGILECGTMTWNRHFEKPRAVIRFGTSSHDFVTSFDRLAHRLGLRISITTTAPRNQSRVTYTVSPSVPDLWRLGRDLHFATNEAREYWQEFLDQERPRDLHDIIPIMREDALHIMWSSFAGERNYSIAATARRIGSVTRLSAEHLAEGQPRDIYPQLFAALDADNILWERINGFNRTKSSALITTEKSR
ncbi:hypothetical protein [Parapedobacter pyrenivorans]|uniref:hypothetical protein n=1 Tax=Parapedobacter pyrenivorans TaxID=1305674 RepID=UPI00333EA274